MHQENETCFLTFKDSASGQLQEETSTFVVGADGAQSAIREAAVSKSSSRLLGINRLADKTQLVYRTIPLFFPPSWRRDISYSVRLKSGINLESLPTKEGKSLRFSASFHHYFLNKCH